MCCYRTSGWRPQEIANEGCLIMIRDSLLRAFLLCSNIAVERREMTSVCHNCPTSTIFMRGRWQAPATRQAPDYSSNLCPPKIWSIWLFQGVFLGLLHKKKKEAGPKHPLQKSYRSYFSRAQIRWVIWRSPTATRQDCAAATTIKLADLKDIEAQTFTINEFTFVRNRIFAEHTQNTSLPARCSWAKWLFDVSGGGAHSQLLYISL